MTGSRSRAKSLAAVILGVQLVAACAGAGSGTRSPESAAPHDAALAADGIAFDRAVLELPAARAFTLRFENREGAPHNVSLVDPSSGARVFEGEIFSGPDSRSYQVPRLVAGEYRFLCDVHPEMSGIALAS